ncbi:MAG: hypothetical protein WCS85_00415 [Candidatus Peribacteraceae bacterium]
MGAEVPFAPPQEEAAVEFVSEDSTKGRKRHDLPVSIHRTMLLHVPEELHSGALIGQKLLPERLNNWKERGIRKNPLLSLEREFLIEIPNGSFARQPALFDLALHPAFHVSAQIAAVLRRHAALKEQQECVVIGIVRLFRSNDLLNFALLEFELQFAAIETVARQTVNLPAEDRLCLFVLQTPHEGIEALSAGHPCRALVRDDVYDLQTTLYGQFLENPNLIRNGLDLPLFFLRRFTGVEEAAHRRDRVRHIWLSVKSGEFDPVPSGGKLSLM